MITIEKQQHGSNGILLFPLEPGRGCCRLRGKQKKPFLK